MSIAGKLEYLDNTKDYIRQCIQRKGVAVPSDTTFRQYGDKILEITTDAILQDGVATATGQDFEIIPDKDYDGFSKILVTGDYNLKPENIVNGITIYGITGTAELKPEVGIPGSSVPVYYQSYFDKAKELYIGDYKNLMILESDMAVAFGFMLDGFMVQSYSDNNTEFTASEWVYVAYNKKTKEWKVEPHVGETSGGNTFIKNIRYSDTYIYYGERLLYPFITGIPDELAPDEELRFEILTSDSQVEYLFYFSCNRNGTIDWGDGITDTFDSSISVISHSYADLNANYIVTCKGRFEGLSQQNNKFAITRRITKMLTKFPSLVTDVSFFFYSNKQLSDIPQNLFSKCENIKKANYLFGKCTGITTIPSEVFSDLHSLIDANHMFSECTGITTIPAGIFMNLYSLKDASYMFNGCSSLTTVPPNLFSNSGLLMTISHCFYGCSSLNQLQTKMLDNCKHLSDISYAFYDCNMESIPENFFDSCVSLTDVSSAFMGYSSGTSYSPNRLKSIPSGLFKNCPKIKNIKSLFEATSVESIPDDLFSYTPEVTQFDYIFRGSSLTSIPPSLFNQILTNIKTNGLTRASFAYSFTDCSHLTSIPNSFFELFTDETVYNMSHMFKGCSNLLEEIPAVWENQGANNITHVACFRGCNNALNYSTIPSDWR